MSRSVNLHLMASKSGCSNPPINPHAAEAVDPQAAVECGCRLRDGFDRESWEPAVEPGWEGPGAAGRWVPRQTAATARERDRRVSVRLKGALRRVVAPPRPKPEPAVEGELGRPADVAVADTTIANLLARVRDHRRADAATAGRLGHTDGADRSAVVA